MNIKYKIFKSQQRTVDTAVRDLLSGIPKKQQIVRLVFFCRINSNNQYLDYRARILDIVTEFFQGNRPLVTVIAQAPLDAFITLECQILEGNTEYEFKYLDNKIRYALIKNSGNTFLLTEGIVASDLDNSMYSQATEVFDKLSKLLALEHFEIKNICRQWNYIEDIVGEKDLGLQNYQQLNDARSKFYEKTEWENGYPAATGIGTQYGGIMVEIDASDEVTYKSVSIDNDLQVAAHAYSSNVLVGSSNKTTPKFERAKALVYDKTLIIEYISGTAAIRGEQSFFDVGIEKQTIVTLENIEFLINPNTLYKNGIDLDKEINLSNFRTYIKNEQDFDTVYKIITERYPGVEVVYVLSDVCRDELLIEIEGIANN